MKTLKRFGVLALAVLSLACDRPAEDVKAKVENVKAKVENVAAKVLSWKETEQLIQNQSDKVVVLDIWSTSCLPCMREFPGLVSIHNQHKDKVTCISLNVDYYGVGDGPSEELQNNVRKFLRKQKATCLNVICSDSDEHVYDTIGFGSIPAVFVYDRSGKLSKQFTDDPKLYGPDGFTYKKDIGPLVEKLIEGG
jgi:thiol-disulfide isomerase/thioredoxin